MLFADLFTPPPGMEGYIRLFGAKWSGWLGLTPQEFEKWQIPCREISCAKS
jgi:hypothetical protein